MGTEGCSRTALKRMCICFETNSIWVENASECGHEPEKGRLSTSVSDMHSAPLMWMSKTHWLCSEKLLKQGTLNSCKFTNNATHDRTCRGQLYTHTNKRLVKLQCTFFGTKYKVNSCLHQFICTQHRHTQAHKGNKLMRPRVHTLSHSSVPCHDLAHYTVSEVVLVIQLHRESNYT